MATEPTLGARILDAAEEYADAVQAAYDEWGAGEWTHHHDEDTAEEHDKLRALAARADAAERLAVAADTYSASCLLFDENDHPDVAAHYRESTDEYDNALAAWRAITEGGVSNER